MKKTTDEHGAPLRLALAFTVVMALIWLAVGCAHAAESGTRPNVLLLICDDCGYGDVTLANTPSLTDLAAESARFTDGYANSLCSPTRAALYTGRYSERSRIYSALAWNSTDGMPLAEVTLAEQLKAVGYRTGLVGKWHLGHIGAAGRPLQQGYDEFFGSLFGAIDPFTHQMHTSAGLKGVDWWRGDKLITDDPRYSVYADTDESIDFIKRSAGSPWFLTVAYHAVHAPRIGPDGREDYFGMLRAMDTGIGQILATLETTGQAENTLVWFISDNGGYPAGRNGGLKGVKGQLWEGGIRVQTYVRWPSRITPTTRGGVVHVVDAMPTVLDIVGVAPAHALDGQSLKGTLLNGTPVPYRRQFWSQGSNFAVRDGQWKLVRQGGTPWLFNLAVDRNEIRNVAGANGARVRSMTQMINTWRGAVER